MPDNPPSDPDPNIFIPLALMLWKLYISLVSEGFTAEQAIEIGKAVLLQQLAKADK